MTAARHAGPADHAAAFRWPVRIYWEDTDAAGIVFYANYLKFFERARTEWLRSLGFEQEVLRASAGLGFVVTDTALHYREPARLDDVLEVTVQVAPRRPGEHDRGAAGAAGRPLAGRWHDPGRLRRSRNFPAAPHP